MNGTLMNVSASTSGTVTPKTRIDALSRDDLIRFVKKQIDKLKTVKCENEKLKNDLVEVHKNFTETEEKWHAEVEKNAEKAEEIKLLNEKCDDLKEECSKLTLQLEVLKERLEVNCQEMEKEMAESSNHEKRSKNYDENVNIVKLENELASVKNLLREQTEKYDKQMNENEQLTFTVTELRSLLDDAHAQLELYKEKKSVENVITLEMADFEKTVERLQKELKVANDEKQSTRFELEASMKEMDNLREEKARLNDNIAKLKAALRKMRKEIEEKKAELTLHEKEQKTLEEQLEKQISARNMEREQLMGMIGINEEKIHDLEASNASLTRQLMSLHSQRESLQRQLDDLIQEHSSFKTRAHYVLEQKKSENDERVKGEIEILEETIRQQKKIVDNLTSSHRMLQNELDSSAGHVRTLSTELSNLQKQLSNTTEMHQKELAEQRREFESRLASEAKLNSELLAQIDANFTAYNHEKENLLISARQERENLQEEMERLKHTLDEEMRRRKEAERMQVAVTTQNVPIQLQKPSADTTLPFSSHLKRSSKAAAVAIGENNTKNDESDEKIGDKSLEEVIYGEDEELNITDIWNEPEIPISWQDTAERTMRQLGHTRELLNESEATNARLVEQTKVLKEEIRRMERNREREDHLANIEYLKNVIMKFIAPEKVTDERGQLIPILATMLKLSNDEVDLLSQVAQANVATNKTTVSTWKNYLWSSLS